MAKMASSHDGTCTPDLLQGLFVGTSPLVCADITFCHIHLIKISDLLLLYHQFYNFEINNNKKSKKYTISFVITAKIF